MIKKLAKLKYLPNNFEVVEHGDFVICAILAKKLSLRSSTIGMLIFKSHTIRMLKHQKKEKIATNN